MNKRFKFRAWFEGRYIYKSLCDSNVYTEDDKCICLANSIPYLSWEQCTCLKDKNGKLIYEGDICIPAKDMADRAGEVYRAESGAYFIKGRMKSGMEYDFGIYWHHYMYEIIGNIHKNADLLEN